MFCRDASGDNRRLVAGGIEEEEEEAGVEWWRVVRVQVHYCSLK